MQEDKIVTIDPKRIAELAHSYFEADYRWELDGRWQALAVGRLAPEIERAYPQMMQFGLVSAWNPHSIECPESVNRAADEAMQAALRASGHVYRPGFSSAGNRSWREPSWVVAGMPLQELDALGRRFGQLGVLLWQRGQPVQLWMHARKPPSDYPESDCIRWLE